MFSLSKTKSECSVLVISWLKELFLSIIKLPKQRINIIKLIFGKENPLSLPIKKVIYRSAKFLLDFTEIIRRKININKSVIINQFKITEIFARPASKDFKIESGIILSLFILLNSIVPAEIKEGKTINPVKDICWSCVFPMTFGNVTTTSKAGRRDSNKVSNIFCNCGVEGGVTFGFWEPVFMVDVSMTPFNLVTLGGMRIKKNPTLKDQGTIKKIDNTQSQSTMHSHIYVYPIMSMMKMFTGFQCLSKFPKGKNGTDFAVGWMSEYDITFNNEVASLIMNPEALLYANPIAQAACAFDTAKALVDFPINRLHWCAASMGSLYPLTGVDGNHQSLVSSALLVTYRMIAKMHRMLQFHRTSGSSALCQPQLSPKWVKNQYKTQLVYPVAMSKGRNACQVIGAPTVIYEHFKIKPVTGEGFGILIWRKKSWCYRLKKEHLQMLLA